MNLSFGFSKPEILCFGGILKRDYLACYREREIAIAYQLGEITLYEKPKSFGIWDSITFRSHLHIFN